MSTTPSDTTVNHNHHALPLADLLCHTAKAVRSVREGRSLTAALARCPVAARPGTQALTFAVLRRLGSATAVRAVLVPHAPPAATDALLLSAIALLWDDPGTAARPAAYAEHTVVDQAVRAARQGDAALRGGAAFVNAVLRRFLRERDTLRSRLLRDDPVARTNHPAWWIDTLAADWPTQCDALLAHDDRQPPMTLRVNARRATALDYVERLGAAGIAASVVGPSAVRLATPCPVDRLPGFAAGDVSVQDAAAQLAAPLLLGPSDGAAPLPARPRVLDACAAPGGKSAHLLESADIDLCAIDSDPVRLERVAQTLTRLGLSAQLRAGDAGDPATWWDGRPFDAVLLDAPCTASGIVRRHPDVRWLRRPDDIPALAATQRRLLDALWPLVAPGGRLLYCTCSVFRDEGAHQIDAFLQRTGDATLADAPAERGHLLPFTDNGTGLTSDLTRDPQGGPAARLSADADPDTFYYALLLRHS